MKTMELWNRVKVTDPSAVKKITGKPDCIIWPKSKTPAGYGRSYKNGKFIYAHREVAERYYGPIPSGMMVGHKCDVPSCVNPEHLFVCTHAENMADMRMKGRACGGAQHKSVTQPDSVQHGECVGTSKLTVEKVAEIRALYSTPGRQGVRRDITIQSLATRYDVSYGCIYKIINRRTWI